MSDKVNQHLDGIRDEVATLESALKAEADHASAAEATIVKQQAIISELKAKLNETSQPPLPTEEPAPPPPPASGRFQIKVAQATIAADLKRVRDDTDLLFPAGETVKLPFGINIVADRVTLDTYGGTAKATLVGDGDISVIISIGGTADGTKVRNLHLTSNDKGADIPNAVFNSGTNTTFEYVSVHNVKYFINNKASARNLKVLHCSNTQPGGVKEHWCYDNGRGTLIEDCDIRTPLYASYRCNNVNRVVLRNNNIEGGPNQEGRITIQKGDGFLVEGNTIRDTHIGNGPLGGKDAFLQEGQAGMLAARTLNTVWKNNKCQNVKLIVGNRSENTTIEGNTGLTVVVEKDTVLDPSKYGLAGQTFTLPGAKTVVGA
jgi:hypothetical protein